jgi:hypothetical protein
MPKYLSYLYFIINKFIVVIIVGPVNMWISEILEGYTAYPHVDRLCISTCELCTVIHNYSQLEKDYFFN